LREAKDRPDRTSPDIIFESIRLDEAKRILVLMGIPIPDVPNTVMHSALKEQFVKLSSRNAHDCMVQVLKGTRNLLSLSELIHNLPNSLQSVALSVPLRKLDHGRLLKAVNTPLKIAMEWG
jgi:hypothetical protein